MWLKDVNTRKILFAASAAPANYKLTEEQKEQIRKSFSSYELLGVRDKITMKLLSEEIGLEDKVFMQYDPSYLISNDKFHLPKRISRILEKQRKWKK